MKNTNYEARCYAIWSILHFTAVRSSCCLQCPVLKQTLCVQNTDFRLWSCTICWMGTNVSEQPAAFIIRIDNVTLVPITLHCVRFLKTLVVILPWEYHISLCVLLVRLRYQSAVLLMFICKLINHIFITAYHIRTAYSYLFQGVKQPCFGASVAVCLKVLV